MVNELLVEVTGDSLKGPQIRWQEHFTLPPSSCMERRHSGWNSAAILGPRGKVLLVLGTHGPLSFPSLSLSHYLGDLIKSHGFKHYLLMTPKCILITQTTTQTADSYIHISIFTN